MKVTMLLADHAQAVLGKLYIVGGGWSLTGPGPSLSAIAVKIEVPWTETNRDHDLKIELIDGRLQPVMAQSPTGPTPVAFGTRFQVGRPAGWPQGSPLDFVAAFNLGPLPLAPNARYIWKLSINDKSQDDWRVAFSTRPADAAPPSAA